MNKTFFGFLVYVAVILSVTFSVAVELAPAAAHLRPRLGVWPHVWLVVAAVVLVFYEALFSRLRIARPEFVSEDMRRNRVWFPCFPVDASGLALTGRLLGSYQQGRRLFGPVYLLDGARHAGFADKLPMGPFCATTPRWPHYPRPVATIIGTAQGLILR